MKEIQRLNILLFSYLVAALACGIVVNMQPLLYVGTKWKIFLIILLLSLLTIISYFIYYFWIKSQVQKVLIIGDDYADRESLIDHYSNSQTCDFFAPQILSLALLKNDSPRARLRLEQLRGSRFSPPYITIAVNVEHYCESTEAEQLLLSSNLNRLLHALRHKRLEQKIDLVFTHTEKIPGYGQFSRWVSHQQKSLRFTLEQPLGMQLQNYKNYSRALTKITPDEFLVVLGFFNSLQKYISLLDKLIDNLLLANEGARNRVYFCLER